MFNFIFKLFRGDTAKNDRHIGAEATLTYDTEAKEIRLHDGVTEGGIRQPNKFKTINGMNILGEGNVQTDSISNVIEKASSFTPTLLEAGSVYSCNGGIVTVPSSDTVSFPNGTKLEFINLSTTDLEFKSASGVTVSSMGGMKFIRTQYGPATLIKVSTDSWILIGAIDF